MTDFHRELIAGIETGETFTILYKEDSNSRQIIPRKLVNEETLGAVCLKTSKYKTFKLNQIKSPVIKIRKSQHSFVHSPILISNFMNGFTVGWFFKLPEGFRDALGIKWSNSPIKKGWVQSNQYSFKKGDSIYDSIRAYKDNWGIALKSINYSIQVIDAKPAEHYREEIEKYRTIFEGNHLSNGKNDYIGFDLEHWKFDPGFVLFSLSRSNGEKLIVEESNVYCTQEDFICFLQTGKIKASSGPDSDIEIKIELEKFNRVNSRAA